ncbi:class A beta-lactamase [Dyella sp. GSA-30]|uniref:class A beta-lactamase n=1 Tax=Dyella sp. GSA-30 TaxID=2994496 RepID=UPI002493A172|nr:class A beta-lactamase [Dyella sp. GSA-30]BDU20123.1 beta-lactamase [Dyella sp. GSA-30]
MDRRSLLKGTLLGAAALALRPQLSLANSAHGTDSRLAALERQHGGRLGVAVLDTGSGQRIAYRADERFLMCSTFKLLAASAVLARVDQGMEKLDRRVVFGKDVVLSYAPITSLHVGGQGMTVGELCEAAITVSDNTAANLLLTSLNGPPAITAFARRMGDNITRLDRTEPELNVSSPGDIRDTTTPNAMLADLQKLSLGDVLTKASREQLTAWLRATSTGKDALRAGLPAGWTAGDKTGSGAHGERNDVAIVWPPNRKPLLIAAYYVNPNTDDAGRNRVLAEVGRIASMSTTGAA